MSEITTPLASRYRKLESDRQPYLDRARDNAKVTIPALMPPEGATAHTTLTVGNQSLGARLVNHLTSKLVLALMPPNRPFFRTDIDEISMRDLVSNPGEKSDIQDNLAKYDRALHTHVESSQLRNKANEAVRQLIVSGTVLLHIVDDNLVRVFKLDTFVQRLDSTGTLLEVIIREKVSPLTLDEATRTVCQLKDDEKTGRPSDEDVELYTCFELQDNKRYRVWQEINDIVVPGSEGSFPVDAMPLLSMRYSAIDGEHYGRSYVEEYLGDLVSLETHMKALNDGAVLDARRIYFVSPGSMVTPRQLERAKNGAVLRGNAADVSVLRSEKAADMRVGLEVISDIQTRLSYAFLMHSAIQRSGERVTAEEIRVMARELEEGLGGVYSLLSQEFQLPIVRAYRAILERQKKLPALPKDIVSVKIVTGLEALGRGQDIDQLQLFLNDVAQFGGPAISMLNPRELVMRLAVSRGIDTTDLVKSSEELQQEQTQAMMQSITEQAGPGIVQQAASSMMPQQ